jgi:hypothetical protein
MMCGPSSASGNGVGGGNGSTPEKQSNGEMQTTDTHGHETDLIRTVIRERATSAAGEAGRSVSGGQREHKPYHIIVITLKK